MAPPAGLAPPAPLQHMRRMFGPMRAGQEVTRVHGVRAPPHTHTHTHTPRPPACPSPHSISDCVSPD